MQSIKYEIQVFFTALMFYTRIPCPKWVNHDAEYLNKATRYFPFVGWIVGGLSAITFLGSSYFFSKEVSIVLSFITSVLLTGAFHEDGFADVCDGFGGGWTKEKILDIMKDSRIGAYGVIGILLLYLLRFTLLMNIDATWIPLVIFSAAAFSRFCAATFIFTHSYVRENEDSKAKPVAKKLSVLNLVVAAVFGIAAMLIFKSWYVFILILPVYVLKYFMGNYFVKWIGGYTGDCLGATQQVCEVGYYLFFIILWRLIF